MDEFLTLLTPEEKRELTSQHTPDANSVLKFTSEINSVKSKSGARKLGDRFLPLLQFVQQFSPVMDGYIQADPNQIAPLVWGSIKFVIQVHPFHSIIKESLPNLVQLATNYFDYFDKISDMFQKLGIKCPRYDKIGNLFADSPSLQESIAAFYAITVTFCTKALRFLRTPSEFRISLCFSFINIHTASYIDFKRFAKSVWKPFKVEFQDIENRLGDQHDIIEEEIRLASETAASQARQKAVIYQRRAEEWRVQQDIKEKRN